VVRVAQCLAVLCISLFVVWSLPFVVLFSVLLLFTAFDSHNGISKYFVETFPESIVIKADKLLSWSFLG